LVGTVMNVDFNGSLGSLPCNSFLKSEYFCKKKYHFLSVVTD
jgi:hypothetical protein